ncbi:MAG TPA: hypothetical protein VFO58_14205 [Vicinamibacterales bacterium]|nr:hypothetical protein [Vicinamibacterales bacterium]
MATFRRLIFFAATSLLLTPLSLNAFADAVEKQVLDYLHRSKLCASVNFYDLRVDWRDGIVENEYDREQVRKDDPLTFRDVDLKKDGLNLKVRSPSTRGESIKVSIILSASVKSPTGEFVNQDELGKALGFFTRPCDQESKP